MGAWKRHFVGDMGCWRGSVVGLVGVAGEEVVQHGSVSRFRGRARRGLSGDRPPAPRGGFAPPGVPIALAQWGGSQGRNGVEDGRKAVAKPAGAGRSAERRVGTARVRPVKLRVSADLYKKKTH